MQTFTLDLQTLLQILARQKQHGLLQAEILPNKLRAFRTSQTLQARLILENGIVYGCFIEQSTGESVIEGQDALKLLLELHIMKWYWTPTQPQQQSSQPDEASTIKSETVNPTLDYVPRRTSRGEDLQSLPREYRKILALVDGQRSVRKLASILSTKDEEMVRVLQLLQTRGLIV